jgi:xylulokinase
MYLGLDIGTTATKAVLVDEHHAIVATAMTGYSLYQPTPEISEFDPQAWIDAVRSVVAACAQKSPPLCKPCGPSVCRAICTGLVALDAEGHPVCPAILLTSKGCSGGTTADTCVIWISLVGSAGNRKTVRPHSSPGR